MEPADPRAVMTPEAHVAYLRALTAAGDGTVVDPDGVFLVRNPVPLPFLVNGAARVDASVEAAAVVIEAARSLFGRQGFEVLPVVVGALRNAYARGGSSTTA